MPGHAHDPRFDDEGVAGHGELDVGFVDRAHAAVEDGDLDLFGAQVRHGVGERRNLEVRRGDKTKKITLVTGERPNEDSAQSHTQSAQDDSMLGLALEDLTPRLRQRFRYEGEGRVFIRGVAPGSDADRAGLQPGDIVLQADRQPVRSIDDVRAALKDGKALLYLERESRRFFQPITRSK